MVLTRAEGGAGATGAPRSAVLRGESGAQAVEFALVTPAVALLLVLVLHAALLGADVVAAQGVAREVVREAAVAPDGDVRAVLRHSAGSRPVRVTLSPRSRDVGDLVTADVRLRSRAFAAFGAEVWVPARATMRVEEP